MISVVVPTLQKNKEVFYQLLNSLTKDSGVGEIIVIDNSTQGIDFQHEKVRVLTPKENLYVNPAWNWGVREAKEEIIALLNDDIILAENFCSRVAEKMTPQDGIVGLCMYDIKPVEDLTKIPEVEMMEKEIATYMDCYYGIAMFFYKEAYVEIPNDIKINYGDAWIFTRTKRIKRKNYRIKGQTVYHLGSLSTRQKCFNPIHKQDGKIYNNLTIKWYHRIFSFEEHYDCWRMRILGLTLKFKKNNNIYELWNAK